MRWIILFIVLAIFISACCLEPNVPCIHGL